MSTPPGQDRLLRGTERCELDADVTRRLEAYVRDRGPRLVRTAYLLTGDMALAEDVVQTAMASLLVSWRRVRDVRNLDAYAHRAVVNAVHKAWRRTSHEVPVEVPPDRAAPDPTVRLAEYDHVLRALRTLTPGQRAAVVLHYYEDMTEAAIAEVLGCSVGTVKSQTSRGLARLRSRLADTAAGHAGAGPGRTR